MKNTTKHAGIVAAVLTAAGITGACPGTAFADSSAGQVPTSGSALGTAAAQNLGSDHDGGQPIVVHGPVLNRAPILDGGPILDRGPGRRFDNDGRGRFDNDGPGRRFDNDGPGRRFDNDGRGRFDNDGLGRRFDNDGPGRRFDNDRPIVVRGRARRVDDMRTWASESQTGTVCSVTAGNIVVNGADGTTWTWTTDQATTIRVVGARGTLADLRAGDRIQVMGSLNGTVRRAESVLTVSRAESVLTVSRAEAFVAPRHVETFEALSAAETFMAPRHSQIHPRHERDDRCEHADGSHGRGEHCEHHANSHRRGHHGGRHRL